VAHRKTIRRTSGGEPFGMIQGTIQKMCSEHYEEYIYAYWLTPWRCGIGQKERGGGGENDKQAEKKAPQPLCSTIITTMAAAVTTT